MATKKQSKGKLERTLGLKAALAIGIGTMVGAGIFVFPGIAAGETGPAAMISFALGGMIALLVAAATAELSTAMPASGGGYYFVSRTFGPLWGTLVGIAQWIGLVFASAFYLTGFGRYILDLLRESGYSADSPVVLFALGTALVLTLVNLFGTKKVGKLQNIIVLALTMLLGILFLYGAMTALGWIGAPRSLLPFAPQGVSPIFSTTALIFTAYLGFVQIAAVGGEIKNPQRNLPRALIGSVLVVMFLYVLAIFVSTSVLSTQKLAALGETAMVEVARELLGKLGALVVLGAGLLATLSSANASILSSSRAIFALSNDRLLPPFFSRINARFGTPHTALLAVGIPIGSCTLLGRIEILAEVASLLHLFIYGMICLALIGLRRRTPLWYVPTFLIPGAPWTPALGALASFALIALMAPLSMMIGGSVMVLAVLWYFIYGRKKEVSEPEPPHIAPELRGPRILIPIAVPDPAPVPKALLKPFDRLDVMLLGYREVPEQTSPEQSREEFGAAADADLEQIARELEGDSVKTTTELVFTPDLTESINHYLEAYQCQALLTVKPIAELQRLLVPIYHRGQISKRLATVLRDLAATHRIPIRIALIESKKQGADEALHADEWRQLVQRRLELSGLKRQQLHTEVFKVKNIAKQIKSMSRKEDLLVLSESKADDRNNFFQNLHQQISDAVDCPILVIRFERESEAS